jgi:hypothetical protein
MHFPHPEEIKASRRRLTYILASVLVLIGVVTYICWPDEEPVYQGRTLGSWLQDYSNPLRRGGTTHDLRSFNLAGQFETSRQAVLAIGTNALPTLLKYLRARDSLPKKALLACARTTPTLRAELWAEQDKHAAAQAGFMILEHNALPATPALIQLTKEKDPGTRMRAYEALVVITQGDVNTLMPVLAQFGRDPEPENRNTALRHMQLLLRLSPEEAQKTGAYETFPELLPPVVDAVKSK